MIEEELIRPIPGPYEFCVCMVTSEHILNETRYFKECLKLNFLNVLMWIFDCHASYVWCFTWSKITAFQMYMNTVYFLSMLCSSKHILNQTHSGKECFKLKNLGVLLWVFDSRTSFEWCLSWNILTTFHNKCLLAAVLQERVLAYNSRYKDKWDFKVFISFCKQVRLFWYILLII